jgi:hypothetical protein
VLATEGAVDLHDRLDAAAGHDLGGDPSDLVRREPVGQDLPGAPGRVVRMGAEGVEPPHDVPVRAVCSGEADDLPLAEGKVTVAARELGAHLLMPVSWSSSTAGIERFIPLSMRRAILPNKGGRCLCRVRICMIPGSRSNK